MFSSKIKKAWDSDVPIEFFLIVKVDDCDVIPKKTKGGITRWFLSFLYLTFVSNYI